MQHPERYVADLDALADPGAIEFKGNDPDWPFRGIVVRWDGEVHAYQNRCPHAGHGLNMIANQFFNAGHSLLICSSHGAMFEPATGYCVAGPCPGASLLKLPCRVRDNKVYVAAPDSARNVRPGGQTNDG
jgi:nitrite reductase/ring-hydroxylating ferredoxin subunit